MAPSSDLVRRQGYYDNDGYGWWGYSETAYVIKWVITAVVLVALVLFFVGGYFHARMRMKKGLPPLRYHRWLVPRRQREQYFPSQSRVNYHHAPYGHGQAVPLHNYGPPPPAYGEQDYVPPYAPPQGASKVNPDQSYDHNQQSGPSQPPPAAGVYR
ncbi:hypothetical protein LTR70_005849 [Exophiala xenobiotica]|uniref:Uncharacterized protein n=1 Tax=Lithohypha guttulata TaxID=1690604 RepID=A0ABR0K8Y6_9EURO|nr:hypothetical protein LTR24_005445 [Lithohypha guttulata]KAK5317349.1 hypothetical protein LTR70_005849 [Exophiala xenobiotica]